MPGPRTTDWLAIALTLLSLPVIFVHDTTGVVLVALWLGTAVLLVGSRQRYPRFVPRKPPAPEIQNLESERIEGLPRPYGAYWMIFPFTLSATVAPASFLSPTNGVLAFAIPSGLTLLLWFAFLRAHERSSALVANQILDAKASRRVAGVVRDVDRKTMRIVSWHVWSGTHHGEVLVETAHNGMETVATVTHTRNEMGYREEIRGSFTVGAPDGDVIVHGSSMLWAGEPRALTQEQQREPPLRKRNIAEEHTLKMFKRTGAQCEEIREGDQVVVLAPSDTEGQRELTGSASAPLVVYAVGSGDDPVAQLRHLRTRRRAAHALLALSIAAVVAEIASRPLP